MRQIFQFYRGMPTLYLSLVIQALATLVLSLACLPIASKGHAAAPITPSGLNTEVNLSATPPAGKVQYDITGGTRAGTNLFHSFGDFNVPNNNIANFLNTSVNGVLPATSNILGRVTGGNISNIFGTIQTTGFGNANLFLMNPAGFLFGPNATINVGGMMTFTTADYMRLADGGRFNANPNATPTDVLTAAPVAAFGFLGANPAAITFESGQLTVAGGTGLALVGGDINLVPDASGTPSSITAPGRPIQMTSVAGPGEVDAITGIPATGMALGTISLGQGTTLSTVGDPSFGDGSGGAISIRAGQFVATGAQILTSPVAGSAGQGGTVTILTTGPASFTDSTIDTHSDAGNGGGGAVSVTGSDITLQNTGLMTGAYGDFLTPTIISGGAGAVTLTGSKSISLIGSSITTDSLLSNGNGGAVSLTAPIITFDGSFILTTAGGDGITPITASSGPVTLNGSTSVSLTQSVIITESFETQGNAGSVKIMGGDVTIGGNAGPPTIATGAHTSSGDPNAGNGGDIEIVGNNVTFTDAAQLQSVADTFGSFGRGGNIRIRGGETILLEKGSLFLTTTISSGNAGNIELVSPHVTLTGGSSLFSDTFGIGGAGTIRITGTKDISLQSGSILSTTAVPFSDGPAGVIELNTPVLMITGGSAVRSETIGSGPGGTVTVQGINGPAQSVLISDPGSGIFTDTLSINFFGTVAGTGTGGSIFLNANSVTLQNGGTLSASTSGLGNAGNILVKADSLSLTSGGQITSSSSIRQTPLLPEEEIPPPTGNAGTVTIQGLASPAQSVLIDGPGSGIFTNTQGSGTGGTITIDANAVAMTNGAAISSNSAGFADAGNINLIANNGLSMQGSSITTLVSPNEGSTAGGGNIKVTTSPEATVYLQNSTISASVADGPGGGGNISVDPQFVILQNSQILAQAAQGQGGAITITAGLFLPDAISRVNADSGSGLNGTVTIQSPNSPASGRIIPLSQKPLLATALLTQRCAALAQGNFSSFTVAGRDSLPAEPGSWLSAPLAITTLSAGAGQGARGEGNDGREAGGEPPSPSPLPQWGRGDGEGEMPILSLRQIAPPGFLTHTFAVDEAAGCRS